MSDVEEPARLLFLPRVCGMHDLWDTSADALPRRKLGIYIDLSKCSSIEADEDFDAFEHAFVSELYEAISDQLRKFWPTLSEKSSLLNNYLFKPG